MKPLLPYPIVHRGRVPVRALLFQTAVLGNYEAASRLLAHWGDGARAYQMAHGYLLVFPAPQYREAEQCPGLALTAHGSQLRAAPWSDRALASLGDLAAEAVLLVHEGRPIVERLGRPVDAASLVSLPGYRVVTVSSLGDPPTPPAPALPDLPRDARALLGAVVAPAVPGADAVVEAMARFQRREGGGTKSEGRGSGLALFGGVVAGAMGCVVLGLLHVSLGSVLATVAIVAAVVWPIALLRRAARRHSGSSANGATRSAPEAKTPAPSRLRGLWNRLTGLPATWLTRTLAWSRIARVLGRRQAAYLQRMFEMFESGDFAQALRHAIPLGDGASSSRPALGLPSPRADLRIHPSSTRASSILFSDDDLYAAMRTLYRKAVVQLTAQGRFAEAAFALAELLHADEEAVSLLETHGERLLAAELAEGRRLAPGLVVRQWLMADRPDRAIAVARKTGAFADAMERLAKQPQHKASADRLRLLWGDMLASSGNYLQAAETVMPVADTQALVAVWLEQAIAAGGPCGARALARLVALHPEWWEKLIGSFEPMLAKEDASGRNERSAFVGALLGCPEAPRAAKVLARAALRTLIADSAAHPSAALHTLIDRAVAFVGDRAFSADMPPRTTMTARPEGPFEAMADVRERGVAPVYDAAFLPSGRLLLAMGELGIRLLSRDGRGVRSIDQPAYRLVVSNAGTRAIAVAPRGMVSRIARIDLSTGASEHVCDTVLDAFCRSFDGSSWIVARPHAIDCADALSPDLGALHRVSLGVADGRPTAIWCDAHHCVLVTSDGRALERWQFDLPSWTLRLRSELSPVQAAEGRMRFVQAPVAVDTAGAALLCALGVEPNRESVEGPAAGAEAGAQRPMSVAAANVTPTPSPVILTVASGRGASPCDLPLTTRADPIPVGLVLSEKKIAVALRVRGGAEAHLFERSPLIPIARWYLEGATHVSLWLNDETWVVGDDLGRVLVLDAVTGRPQLQHCT